MGKVMPNSGALENRISVFVSKRRLHLIHHRELFGATRRVAFPVTAARTLPIELLGFEAATSRDYPVIFGTLYFFTLLGLLANIVSDLTYRLVDPRIDFENR